MMKDIDGMTLIERTVSQCQKTGLDTLVVTDNQNIADLFGDAIVTGPCESGTARIASVIDQITDKYIINVQGDQPFINPDAILEMANFLDTEQPTVATPVTECLDLEDPSKVKVVVSNTGRALYFSRQPLPESYQHIGIYGYHRSILEQFDSLEESPHEGAESLEQLKFLDNDIAIHTYWTEHQHFAVDTPQDLQDAVKYAREHR
tara:strand:- start:1446 stop:2060 length:615 start_codon:yes stop_codon:yes gene_type:complete